MKKKRIVEDHGDHIIIKRVNAKTGALISQERREKSITQLAADSIRHTSDQGNRYDLSGAPSVRTNAIPGEPSRVSRDDLLGQEFSTRGERDRYMKDNGLVDLSVGELHKPGPKPPKSPRPGIRRFNSPAYNQGLIESL